MFDIIWIHIYTYKDFYRKVIFPSQVANPLPLPQLALSLQGKISLQEVNFLPTISKRTQGVGKISCGGWSGKLILDTEGLTFGQEFCIVKTTDF